MENVLSPFLNEKTDGDCLRVRGNRFQYLEAVMVKVLSPASFRVILYVRRRGSLEARTFLRGVYRVKQSRRYRGACLLRDLKTNKSNLKTIRCRTGSQCNESRSGLEK